MNLTWLLKSAAVLLIVRPADRDERLDRVGLLRCLSADEQRRRYQIV